MAQKQRLTDAVEAGLASANQLAADAEVARLRSEVATLRGRYKSALAAIDAERERADAIAGLTGIKPIEASPACSCNAMARKMDTQPIEWSESGEGMAKILEVMRAEHGKRWSAGKTILPWTDAGARQLVLLACRRSRAKAAS
jgi:hypothetical protein